MKGV
jgi:hypothetical protein